MLVYPSPRRVAAHRGIGLSDNSGQKAAALSSLFIAAGRSLGLGRLPPPGLLGIAAAAERTQGVSGESSGGRLQKDAVPGCRAPAGTAWGNAAQPVCERGCHRPPEPARGGLFWGEPQWEQGLPGGKAWPPHPSREQWGRGGCWKLLLARHGFTLCFHCSGGQGWISLLALCQHSDYSQALQTASSSAVASCHLPVLQVPGTNDLLTSQPPGNNLCVPQSFPLLWPELPSQRSMS